MTLRDAAATEATLALHLIAGTFTILEYAWYLAEIDTKMTWLINFFLICRPECTVKGMFNFRLLRPSFWFLIYVFHWLISVFVTEECNRDKACVRFTCVDPCVDNICAQHATCVVINHRGKNTWINMDRIGLWRIRIAKLRCHDLLANCRCNDGYEGDPFYLCQLPQRIQETLNPCQPSPCGIGAVCREVNGAASCTCILDYTGDPFSECKPECVQNSGNS